MVSEARDQNRNRILKAIYVSGLRAVVLVLAIVSFQKTGVARIITIAAK